MIRSGGVFFVAARPSKPSSREASTLELKPVTAAEVEQATLARERAAFGIPGPAAGATLDGDGEPTVRIRVPTATATPSAEEQHCMKLRYTCLIAVGVNGALRRERRTSRI